MPSRPTVLVVDDNEGFLRVVRSVLEAAPPGFRVATARSGTEALAYFEREAESAPVDRPSFVILDFRLPDMDAPEIIPRLPRRATRPIPVLVLSQAGWEEDESAARAAGATEFSLKPSDVGALEKTVTDFWRKHVHGV